MIHDRVNLLQKTFQEDINLEALSLHGVDNLIAIMKDFITTEYLGAGDIHEFIEMEINI